MKHIHDKVCIESECNEPYWSKGYCRYHYYSSYWNPKNKDRIRDTQKRHYWANLDKYRAKGRADHKRKKWTLNYRYSEYKNSAKDHKREFCLTKDDFSDLWQNPCYYCGGEIKTIGLDRINNEIGYTRENVVPCCIRCNKMKKNINYEDFIMLCRTISLKPIPFAR